MIIYFIIQIVKFIIDYIGIYMIYDFESHLHNTYLEKNEASYLILSLIFLTLTNYLEIALLNLFCTGLIIFFFSYNLSRSCSKRIVISNLFFLIFIIIMELISYTGVQLAFNSIMINNEVIKELFLLATSKCLLYFTYKNIELYIIERNFNFLKNLQYRISLCSLIISMIALIGIALVIVKASSGFDVVLNLLCMLVVLILLIYIFDSMKNIEIEHNEKVEVEIMQITLSNYKEEYNHLISVYKEKMKIVHDLKKYLDFMQIKYGNDDFLINLKNVLNEKKSEQINLVERSNTLKILINRYIEVFNNYNIQFKYKKNTEYLTYMNDCDLIILICNLLDNALEANLKNNKAIVDLVIDEQDDFVMIRCKNTITRQLNIVNNTIKTTKHSIDHGYGVENIKHVVNKHHGDCTLFEKKGWFYFTISIPLHDI